MEKRLKLYKCSVKISHEFVVACTHKPTSKEIISWGNESVSNDPIGGTLSGGKSALIKSMDDLPEGWSGTCQPYGSVCETCEDIFSSELRKPDLIQKLRNGKTLTESEIAYLENN